MNENTKQILRHCERVIFEELAPNFVPEAKFALLIHVPGNPQADVLILSGTIEEAREAFERAAVRDNAREIVGDAPEATPL
jgi:hypothetical protein